MIQRTFWVMYFSFLLCSCFQNNREHSDIISIDANQNYPELELKLSDIAEITYIPLQSDEIIFGYHSAPRALFVYGNKIFIVDKIVAEPKLLVYDRTGKHVQTFGSYGRGPGEYLGIMGLVVDTLANEVTIYDDVQKKLLVYGIDGKFRQEKRLWEINQEQESLTDIEMINENNLLAFNRNSQLVAEGRGQQVLSFGKAMMLIDKQTLSEVPFQSFEYTNPAYSRHVTVAYNLMTTKNGVYITSQRSDTIFFMNKNLEITPVFRDITNYGKVHEGRLFPAMETEKYVLFSTEKEYGVSTISSPNTFPRRFFAYDKKKQQLYRLNNSLPEQDNEYDRRIHAIILNRAAPDQYTLTLNHDYAAILLSPEFLIQHYNQLPATLKEITKNLKEDDNPVVMLMRFK